MNCLLKTTAVVLAIHLSAQAGVAEQYAFLVGVGGYDEKHLKPLGEYPRRDAIEFRDALLGSGFRPENIVLMVDDLQALPRTQPVGRYLPEAAKIRKELELLIAGLQRDDTLIIALAGHGVQFKNDNEPFFCPLDARLDDRESLVSLDWLYDKLRYDALTGQGCKPRQKLVLIDACRRDPESVIRRSSGGGDPLASLTRPQIAAPPEGVVALFSCAEGQEALQHEPLKHGVFFYHVLESWKGKADANQDRKVTLDELIAYTKSETTNYARVKLAAPQTPRQRGYFDGTWILNSLTFPAILANTIGMQLKLIPAGSFLMGSPASDGEAEDDERPQREVRLTRSYYLGATEVTQGQWTAVMGTRPWSGKEYVKEGEKYPATHVSWDDAQAFCQRLSEKEGRGYRLPTEAEWERAARGGATTRYSFGDDSSGLGRHAWFGDNANKVGERYAHEVGGKLANAYGLHDMHGNVWEWCQDWQGSYEAGSIEDPPGAATGSFRVLRGGSWNDSAGLCRSAIRDWYTPSSRSNDLGFRVALSPSGE